MLINESGTTLWSTAGKSAQPEACLHVVVLVFRESKEQAGQATLLDPGIHIRARNTGDNVWTSVGRASANPTLASM